MQNAENKAKKPVQPLAAAVPVKRAHQPAVKKFLLQVAVMFSLMASGVTWMSSSMALSFHEHVAREVARCTLHACKDVEAAARY